MAYLEKRGDQNFVDFHAVFRQAEAAGGVVSVPQFAGEDGYGLLNRRVGDPCGEFMGVGEAGAAVPR